MIIPILCAAFVFIFGAVGFFLVERKRMEQVQQNEREMLIDEIDSMP
jgi:hypothetical protein